MAHACDAANRMQIINWCEKLRNAYCQKDIRMLDDLFSDDALIITGRGDRAPPQ